MCLLSYEELGLLIHFMAGNFLWIQSFRTTMGKHQSQPNKDFDTIGLSDSYFFAASLWGPVLRLGFPRNLYKNLSITRASSLSSPTSPVLHQPWIWWIWQRRFDSNFQVCSWSRHSKLCFRSSGSTITLPVMEMMPFHTVLGMDILWFPNWMPRYTPFFIWHSITLTTHTYS